MNDFIFKRKYDNVSMDTYLTEVKEIIDLLEEVAVEISKPLVVNTIVQNLPDEYVIFKRIFLDSNVLPYYKTCTRIRAHGRWDLNDHEATTMPIRKHLWAIGSLEEGISRIWTSPVTKTHRHGGI